MSAGARLGMPATEEAALLSSVLHAHRWVVTVGMLCSVDRGGASMHACSSLNGECTVRLMSDRRRLQSESLQARDVDVEPVPVQSPCIILFNSSGVQAAAVRSTGRTQMVHWMCPAGTHCEE